MFRKLGSFGLFSAYATRRYASATVNNVSRFSQHKTKYIFGGITVASVAVVCLNEPYRETAHHIIQTSERVGVVTVAVAKCFSNYRKTLDATYNSKEERKQALSDCHLKCAQITLAALEKNGGIYIKLGQHVSAMSYLLPREWTDTMMVLQDQCPESSLQELDAMFRSDLGVGIDDLFTEFSEKPVGVASLAQVHLATLKNGDKVAVKCQHPSLQEFVPLDVFLTNTVFDLLAKVFPEFSLTWLGDELRTSIYIELDFTKEAENAINTARYFSQYTKQTALRIPKVKEAHKRILIMESVRGYRVDDLESLDKNGIDRAAVSSCLSHIFNNMIFTPGVGIHCDPHGGNLAIKSHVPDSQNPHNFEIVLYDHGLYRQVSTEMRRDYAHFWLALLDKDQESMRYYAKRFAGISDKQFPLFSAAITGRDINTALNLDTAKSRTQEEIDTMHNALKSQDFLETLMSILAHVPRVVLMILKTNDLTRHLDECLQSPLGLERTFLIMSQYCAKTVYAERLEQLAGLNWWMWIWAGFGAWFEYEKRISKLWVYDWGMYLRRL